MDTEKLTIPHPGLEYREFVLIPLMRLQVMAIKFQNMEVLIN